MARRDTGRCAPYTELELTELGSYITKVVASTGDIPTAIRAQVEYNGHIARANNGVRTFRPDKLSAAQRARVAEAARKALNLRQEAREARPKKTYQAKGWQAQFRQLSKTAKGREAMERAGVSAAKRTRGRWLAGQQAPMRATREAIARAYESMRMENVNAASQRAGDAIREVAQLFDEVIAESEYGENGVRFRGIIDS